MLGDHSPRGLSLSLCCPCAPQASRAIPSSVPMGSLSLCPDIGAGGMSGDSATSTWMTTGTSLMVPGELSGRDMGSSGTMEPAPTLVRCHPSLKGRRRLIATTDVAFVPLALLTGLYSGSQSGMLRLLISEAIFFLCPGLVTPMAVRSWGREGGQCCPGPAVPPSHRPRPHLRRHPADGGDVVASVDEVGRVELQLELAEPLVHGLRALRREGQMDRGSSRDGGLPLLPVSPKLSPHAPRSPSPLTAAPFSSAGARRGAGGRTGSWPRSATATNLPEGQRSAGPGLPGRGSGQVQGGYHSHTPGWQGRGRRRRVKPSPAQQPRARRGALDTVLPLGEGQVSCRTQHSPQQWDSARSLLQSHLEDPRVPGAQAAARGVPLPKSLWPHSSGLAISPGRLARAVHPLPLPTTGIPWCPSSRVRRGALKFLPRVSDQDKQEKPLPPHQRLNLP